MKLFVIRIKLSYYKVFHKNLLAVEMKRTQILINKAVYLGLSILEIRKMVMSFGMIVQNQNMVKRKTVLHGYSFIVYIKTDDIHKDTAEDVETRFDTH